MQNIREQRQERLAKTNQLIELIAANGRHFFRGNTANARFEFDKNGRLWWIDSYKQTWVYAHQASNANFRGFTEGGTLRALMLHLREYIMSGVKLPPSQLGPWPEWYSDGDPWGYGADMATVRQFAETSDITEEVKRA